MNSDQWVCLVVWLLHPLVSLQQLKHEPLGASLNDCHPNQRRSGRPAIETRELPPDIRIAIQARSQGLTWKAAVERAGTTATRVRGFMQRHPDAKAFLEGYLQDRLDQSHSILNEAAPEAAQCLIDIIRDGRCKPYSKI